MKSFISLLCHPYEIFSILINLTLLFMKNIIEIKTFFFFNFCWILIINLIKNLINKENEFIIDIKFNIYLFGGNRQKIRCLQHDRFICRLNYIQPDHILHLLEAHISWRHCIVLFKMAFDDRFSCNGSTHVTSYCLADRVKHYKWKWTRLQA